MIKSAISIVSCSRARHRCSPTPGNSRLASFARARISHTWCGLRSSFGEAPSLRSFVGASAACASRCWGPGDLSQIWNRWREVVEHRQRLHRLYVRNPMWSGQNLLMLSVTVHDPQRSFRDGALCSAWSGRQATPICNGFARRCDVKLNTRGRQLRRPPSNSDL